MTKAERNKKLKHLITCMKCEVNGKCCDENCSTQYDAGNMGEIIENLEAISNVLEQEPCEDAISRQVIIKTLNKIDRYVADELTLCDTERIFPQNEVFIVDDVYEKIVEQLPSVTPQPKTGHWFIDERPESDGGIICSNCEQPVFKYHKIDFDYRPKFCPNCGTRMKENKT